MTFTARQQAHLQSQSTLPLAPPPLTAGSLTTISIDNLKTRQSAMDNGSNLLLTNKALISRTGRRWGVLS